jgi:uncharacterized protein YjbJ (UPF0337 family)
MTDSKETEETAGGPLGKLAGKAKETAGAVLRDEELAREGRLQQAQAEAEAEATQADAEARQREVETEVEAASTSNEIERERLKAELAAEEREAAIGRDQHHRVRDAATRAEQEKVDAERERRLQETAASRTERQAEAKRLAEQQAAARLEEEARRAEARANSIDPEETT